MSQGSSCARRSSLRIEVENSMRKRKDAKKKQWQTRIGDYDKYIVSGFEM